MKEALMIIASAWSVAFIILFVACVLNLSAVAPGDPDTTARLTCILLAGAVTGVGWLWFRHERKKRGQP